MLRRGNVTGYCSVPATSGSATLPTSILAELGAGELIIEAYYEQEIRERRDSWEIIARARRKTTINGAESLELQLTE